MAKDRFYLLGNEAMGGHRARQGFRFQDLWLAFQLVDWITQQDFHGAVNEGLDDVDASWFRSDKRGRKNDSANFDWEIHQLKDTSITPKLLVEIFDGFRRKEKQFAATLSRYHIVASALYGKGSIACRRCFGRPATTSSHTAPDRPSPPQPSPSLARKPREPRHRGRSGLHRRSCGARFRPAWVTSGARCSPSNSICASRVTESLRTRSKTQARPCSLWSRARRLGTDLARGGARLAGAVRRKTPRRCSCRLPNCRQ